MNVCLIPDEVNLIVLQQQQQLKKDLEGLNWQFFFFLSFIKMLCFLNNNNKNNHSRLYVQLVYWKIAAVMAILRLSKPKKNLFPRFLFIYRESIINRIKMAAQRISFFSNEKRSYLQKKIRGGDELRKFLFFLPNYVTEIF